MKEFSIKFAQIKNLFTWSFIFNVKKSREGFDEMFS